MVNMTPTAGDKQRAKDLVDIEYRPQEGAVQRALNQIILNSQRDVNTQQNFAKIGDQRLAGVYNDLDQKLEGNLGRIDDRWAQAKQASAGFYGGAQQGNQDSAQSVQDYLASRAAALGLQGGGLDQVQGQAQNQANQIQQLLGAMQTNQQGLMEHSGATYGSSAIQAISDAAKQGAFERAGLQRGAQSAITDIQGTSAQQRGDLLQQLRELSQVRGANERATTQELTETRLDRERQAVLDALAAEIQRGTLGIQRSQLGLDKQALGYNRDQQLWERSMREQELQSAIAAANDPLQKARLQLELQQLQAGIDDTYSGINSRNQENERAARDQRSWLENLLRDIMGG